MYSYMDNGRFAVSIDTFGPKEVPDMVFDFDVDSGITNVTLNTDFDFVDVVQDTILRTYKILPDVNKYKVVLSQDLLNSEKQKFQTEQARISAENERIRIQQEEEYKQQLLEKELQIQKEKEEKEALYNKRIQEAQERERLEKEEAGRFHKDDFEDFKKEMLQQVAEIKSELATQIETASQPQVIVNPIKPLLVYEEEEKQQDGWLLLDESYRLADGYEFVVQLKSPDTTFLDVTFGQKIKIFFGILKESFKMIFTRL